MRKYIKIALLYAALIYHTAHCMEHASSLQLFVQTSDNQITRLNKKNVPLMHALNIMAAHQHKEFACIPEEKKKKNSFNNPLNATFIPNLTHAHLKLLDQAIDGSNNKEIFFNFYSKLPYREQIMVFDAATKVFANKIISLIGSHLPQEMQKIITSYIIPTTPSLVELKKALLPYIKPIESVLTEPGQFKYGKALWNPDNSLLISYTNEECVLRDSKTGKSIKDLPYKICNAVFSPDGTRLAYKEDDFWPFTNKASHLCNGHTGECIRTFILHGSSRENSKIKFSPNSTMLIIYNDQNLDFMIYNAQNGDFIQRITHHANINDFVFTSDSKNIISVGKGNNNERIILWDLNGTKIKYLKGHDDAVVTHIAYSPNYSQLATGSLPDGTTEPLILRNAKTGEKIKIAAVSTIKKLLFSPDNKYLLIGAYAGIFGTKRMNILNITNSNVCRYIDQPLNFATALIEFAPDNSFLIIDNTLYDTQTFDPIKTLSNLVIGYQESEVLNLSPDGNRIAVNTEDTLVLYHLFSDEILGIMNAIASNSADLFQIYRFSELCKKFGIKIADIVKKEKTLVKRESWLEEVDGVFPALVIKNEDEI